MGQEYPELSDALLKAILKGDAVEVDERLYSAQKIVNVAATSLESDTVPSGFIGIIMALACNFDASTTYFLKVGEKDRYSSGLTAAGMSNIAVGAGVGAEVALLEFVDEGKKWELTATRVAGALAQNYRLRVRYYAKTSQLAK